MPGIPVITPYPLPTTGDLPVNTAAWQVDPARAVLLVHDMQRYFLTPLPPSVRRRLLHNAVQLRDHFAALGAPVAYTAQPGRMTDEERGLLKDFWGPGMRTSWDDRQVPAELAPRVHDPVFTKWRYSAFVRSRLLQWLRDRRRDQLVLCGVYAHIGVLATAVESFSEDLETFLVADAVADFSERHHRQALEYAAERCAVVLTTKEVTG